MGNLYQLFSKRKLLVDEEFYVDGPFDRWGYVVKEIRQDPNGQYLYFIRGTGNTRR